VRICRAIEVSQSGYYIWKRGAVRKRKEQDGQLTEEIKRIYEKNKGRYGSPRIEKELRKKGIKTSPKRVARLMKENGLKARTKRKYKATTNSRHNLPVAENLLRQDFMVRELNKVWTSDITYIWTTEGWVYLAVVLDICSRNLIGWKTSNYLGKELVIGALNKALKYRKPKSGLIFHSDRGIQYASHEVCKILEKHNITQSMSNKGNCYDNAITETFFHTLKTELIYSTSYETRQEAELDLFEYIELYYNRQRLHSSLNYLSPVEFEKQFFINKTLS
jgi:putative transposase